MTIPVIWLYVGAFAASLLIALALTPLVRRFATRNGTLDRPGGHKSHTSPIPYLGGVAILVAFSAAVAGAAVMGAEPRGVRELGLILGVGLVLSAVGLVDDLRGTSATLRFGLEGVAGAAVWWAGLGVTIFDSDPLNFFVTVLWVVGITNAFNLLDNMDGLSAGVAAIASGFFLLIAAVNGQFLVAALAAGLFGCSLGFLWHNFHPATIYMGDAGSLFIGFLLAVLGIKLRFDGPTNVTFMVPILVLGVAIFDTTLVTVSRILHRKNPFLGGRDHTSHRLVFIGLPVPVAVGLIYAVGVGLGWLGLVVSRVDVATGMLIGGFVLAAAILGGVLLALVPVYENSRRKAYVFRHIDEHEPYPPTGEVDVSELDQYREVESAS